MTTAAHGARLRRFEWAPVRAVWRRELALFTSYWVSSSFGALVEPTVNLLAFGYGFGSLVAVVAGYRYIDFVGTGVVGTAALFTSIFPGMYQTFIRREFQRTYDGVLAAPVDVHELVTAEASWLAVKSAVFSFGPVLVAVGFGLRPEPTVVLVPFATMLAAAGFALFGMWASTLVPSINSFDYIVTGLVTPLYLVAGTFFPVSALPTWARWLAQANPLYHCVQLVRDAVFGTGHLADVWHVALLVGYAALMWVLAVRGMHRRLIDRPATGGATTLS